MIHVRTINGKRHQKRVRGAGRVGFLARRDEFAKLIEAGHPLRSIYNDHQDALDISYSQFTRYVTRYIRTVDDGSGGSRERPKGDATEDRPSSRGDQGTPQPFQFDPTAGRNKDDLI